MEENRYLIVINIGILSVDEDTYKNVSTFSKSISDVLENRLYRDIYSTEYDIIKEFYNYKMYIHNACISVFNVKTENEIVAIMPEGSAIFHNGLCLSADKAQFSKYEK